jgi:hypothetical protein
MKHKYIGNLLGGLLFACLAVPAHAGYWVKDHVKVVAIYASTMGANGEHTDVEYSVTAGPELNRAYYDALIWAESSSSPQGTTGDQQAMIQLGWKLNVYVTWIPAYPGEPMPNTAQGAGIMHEHYMCGPRPLTPRTMIRLFADEIGSTSSALSKGQYAGFATYDTWSLYNKVGGPGGWDSQVRTTTWDGEVQTGFPFHLNDASDDGESGTHVCEAYYLNLAGWVWAQTANDSSDEYLSDGATASAAWAVGGYVELQSVDGQILS